MGALSRELLVILIICTPVVLWTFNFVWSNWGDLRIIMVQVAIVAVGAALVWRLGGSIVEAATRVWERLDLTRAWDKADQETTQQSAEITEAGAVTKACAHCGHSISVSAQFCRYCGNAIDMTTTRKL